MDSVSFALFILFNMPLVQGEIYINDHFIYEKFINQKDNDRHFVKGRYRISDFANRKVHVINSARNKRLVLPLLERGKRDWSIEGEELLSTKIIEEGISFNGCDCVKVERIYKFPSPTKSIKFNRPVSSYSLLCNLPQLRNIIENEEDVYPYIPVRKLILEESYKQYQFELLYWSNIGDAEEKPYYHKETKQIEMREFPSKEVEKLLEVSEVKESEFKNN